MKKKRGDRVNEGRVIEKLDSEEEGNRLEGDEY
jgi:hypothetical protein